MLMDVLVVLAIVVVAAVLGLIVHPLLWFVLILAIVWLISRHGRKHART